METTETPIVETPIVETPIDNKCPVCKGSGRATPTTQCDTCLGTGLKK